MTLLDKLALIRKQVDAVEKQPSTDGDPFTYAPADLVFDVVRDQLRRRKVLALPVRVEELDATRVRLYVDFVDQENDVDVLTVCWIGEGSNANAAATNALKGVFMATFLIEAVEPADLSRREQRQNAVRRNGIASADQLRHRIRRPGIERGLYDAELLEMANAMLASDQQIDTLDSLPKRLVDPLHDKIVKQEKAGATA